MLESFAWGFGTALGELPPYFVARAAALAGQDDEEMDHIEQIKLKPKAEQSLWERVQVGMFEMMQRWGFWGILVCASVLATISFHDAASLTTDLDSKSAV